MSDCADIYSGSCNPPRRAKRLRAARQMSYADPEDSEDQRMDDAAPSPDSSGGYKPAEDVPARPVTMPAKRGRKPSTTSRAVREAQRKLNHSIIEKARRTKINDALATLRQLVPAGYTAGKDEGAEDDDETSDEEEDAGDRDGEYGKKTAKKSQRKGKSGEKGKEYKLEILVRAVSYMQDLIRKVDQLEERVTSSAAKDSSERGKKRKRDDVEGQEGDSGNRRWGEHSSLPPFSALFANASIDPSLSSSNAGPAYLPSPPSSTKFRPTPTTQIPPALVLDTDSRNATSATALPLRTPEDESAATLLLEISGSPPLSYSSRRSSVPRLSPSEMMKDGAHSFISGNRGARSSTLDMMKAQTPGSLLGMNVV